MAIPGDGGSVRRPLKTGLIIRKLWGWAVVAVERGPPHPVCAPSLGLGEHTRGLGRKLGTDSLPLLPERVSVHLLVGWGRPPGAQAQGAGAGPAGMQSGSWAGVSGSCFPVGLSCSFFLWEQRGPETGLLVFLVFHRF